MAATLQSWSDIPLDLAGLVLGRLYAHVDRVRFAAVCPQWRSAARQVKLPPPAPLLALKAGHTFYSMPTGEPLCFAGCDEDFATASGSWLVYHRARCLVLVDPFPGATMTLPDPSSEDAGDDLDNKEGDDSDKEGEDNKDSDDSKGGYDSGSESLLRWIDRQEFKVMKLIVCSPDLVAALFWCTRSNWVAVCRPGGSTWSVAWKLSLWITDIAFYKETLFADDYEEDLIALDITVDDKTGDPHVSRMGQFINVNHFDNPITFMRMRMGQSINVNHFDNPINFMRMLYLVESCGELLLVRRMILHEHARGSRQIHTFDGQCESELVVFKADFWGQRWAKVTSLEDDQALFLGPCSRAVCLPQYDSPGHRLWFLDDYKDYYAPWVWDSSSTSGTSDMANNKKFSSPLPTISWRGRGGPADNVGAVWLFPSN